MRSSIAAAAALLIAFAVWMWWAAAPDPGTDADPAGRAQGTRRSIGREEIDPSTLTPIQVPRDAFEKRAAERAAEAAKRAAAADPTADGVTPPAAGGPPAAKPGDAPPAPTP